MNIIKKMKIILKANALNYLPDEYDRKIKNQRNWLKINKVVEHDI